MLSEAVETNREMVAKQKASHAKCVEPDIRLHSIVVRENQAVKLRMVGEYPEFIWVFAHMM